MDDLLKTIKAQLYDRLSSPLSFSFSLAWLAWNYRVVVILLSSLPPSDKFLALDLLSLTWSRQELYFLCHLFLFPLATSAIYIFALPWAEKIVFEYSLKRKKELKESRQKIEEEMPLSNDEARELRNLAEAAYREYDLIIRTRQEEIARLKLEVSDLKAQMKARIDPTASDSGSQGGLSGSQEAMLRFISDKGGVDVSKFQIFNENPEEPRLRIQYDIDELARRDLIDDHTTLDENDGQVYDSVSLKKPGRKYLIEHLSADLI